MVFQTPEYLDIAGDGIQIILCLLILIYLIRNHIRYKQPEFKETKKIAEQCFHSQYFTQTAKQQVEQAFTNMIENIASERDNLEALLKLNQPSNRDLHLSKLSSNSKTEHSCEVCLISDGTVGSGERIKQIKKFTAGGLSARQISDELKIPMGEVELILSIQK